VKGPSAFVSITWKACSKYCSFCVVPYAGRRKFSRPFEDVLTEIADLADQGMRESDLARAERQRLSREDGGRRDRGSCAAARVCRRDTRHRAHPLHDFLIPRNSLNVSSDAHARIDKLSSARAPPCAIGVDRVLAAMKRGYTALEYKSIARKLPCRTTGPDISISSDFIVRFPRGNRTGFRGDAETG